MKTTKQYFKEDDNTIYCITISNKNRFVESIHVSTINKNNKYLEIYISTSENSIEGIKKVSSEITEKEFIKLENKIKKIFKKQLDLSHGNIKNNKTTRGHS